ncbi:acyl-CoA dehydrogenase [Pseudoalteromonas byunsanensis]|uniref:Acyl-coenzyme A dehydrogenase n=1 Tax=Pseudoalteromonas byunsanensis TaxID=327939 RepID=A0A1S1N7K0_9GAMM|nr:acyl-CoA dehydrogenase [Pseudoalteromonas byunsanensis]OHU97197.1 acyl-CoA dehydrogenase [Pseudoalteromonas byunsanensis]
MGIIVFTIVVVCIIFAFQPLRYRVISLPVMRYFKRALPKLTQTEQEAMEAGDTWWDSQLFSGHPNWNKWHQNDAPKLSDKEQAFIENELQTLLSMLDEQQIRHDKDLPESVWTYLKEKGFFAFIIPKKFGGREFSAQANSTIVAKIASKSLSAAVTVMVPNSLGPAELLMHYGTPEQKSDWLPKLATGEALPCFALTALEAGSDAGAISDFGVVCKKTFQGKKVLGLKLTWSKRYITLAPVATVLGLAFKAYDPDGLLGDRPALGITCALIPTDHKGVKTGPRHNPLDQGFMNGTTEGKDVFIPLDWVIGGQAGIGKGWRMLVSCLSAGRGISLPALSAGTAHLCTRTTSAYARIREQFGQSIADFEGVQESLARIAGLTYSIEACRQTTAQAIDMKKSPAVITAIAKYHLTEMSRIVMNDALDIHGGKAIQKGPSNYLANNYTGIPISITVEGANILTRNLMIFGQGATRCHPFIFKEIQVIQNSEADNGLREFDKLLMSHMQHTTVNVFKALWLGLTRGYGLPVSTSGPTQKYYQKLNWLSVCLAVCADLAMLRLGGDLKRKEMLSARLGDVLSHLYLASCVLKKYEHDGRQQGDLKAVHYALSHHLKSGFTALDDFIDNFTNRFVGQLLKRWCHFFGHGAKGPSDYMVGGVCTALWKDKNARERISHLCCVKSNPAVAEIEEAYLCYKSTIATRKKLKQWQSNYKVYYYDKSFVDLVSLAVSDQVMSQEEAQSLIESEDLRQKAIAVDVF